MLDTPPLHRLALVLKAREPLTGNRLLRRLARLEMELMTTPCDYSCEASPSRPAKPILHDYHLRLPRGRLLQNWTWNWLMRRRWVYLVQARLNATCSLTCQGYGHKPVELAVGYVSLTPSRG